MKSYRSAVTGRFVTEDEARSNPRETVEERGRKKRKGEPSKQVDPLGITSIAVWVPRKPPREIISVFEMKAFDQDGRELQNITDLSISGNENETVCMLKLDDNGMPIRFLGSFLTTSIRVPVYLIAWPEDDEGNPLNH